MEATTSTPIIREGTATMSVFMAPKTCSSRGVQRTAHEFDKKIGYRFFLRQLLLPCSPAGERIA